MSDIINEPINPIPFLGDNENNEKYKIVNISSYQEGMIKPINPVPFPNIDDADTNKKTR